jgi:hypothetical protein
MARSTISSGHRHANTNTLLFNRLEGIPHISVLITFLFMATLPRVQERRYFDHKNFDFLVVLVAIFRENFR